MEDGRHWELQRLYQDFYDLQINLIQEHPLEAGNVKGHERTLPYMPGPVTYVTDNISNGRRANLDEYIRNLLKLGPHITRSNLVRVFFAPREGDYEIDPNVGTDDYRLSSASQDSPANPSNAASPQSSAGNLSQQNSYQNGNQQHSRPGTATQQNPGSQPQHYRTQSQATTSTYRTGGQGQPLTQIKIKVWFETDNCVVIRMPPQFSHRDLYRKLKERRALERFEGEDENTELEVEYKDEVEGRWFPLRGEEELRVGLERNADRFVLGVRAVK
jgi:bud emergence protein 1